VHDNIPTLIKPKVELLTVLVLSMLARDRNEPGMPVHPNILLVRLNLSITLVVPDPSIPLVVQMANLTTKRKTMLNSLPVKYPSM